MKAPTFLCLWLAACFASGFLARVTAAESGSVSAASHAVLWATPERTTGEKLDPKSASYAKAQQEGLKLQGRSSSIDPVSLTPLGALKRGDNVVIPLLGGEQVTGKVNLVRQEDSGWVRIGGELAGARAGSFSVGSHGKRVAGTILIPEERIAYLITEQPDGTVIMEEKALSEVICFPMPRPEDESVTAQGFEPQESPPILSSRPGAIAVLYLDFDGETVTDPDWNSGNTIVAEPPILSSAQMTEVWNRVKEDYWPFNIDVTTDVTRYNNAPVGHRMRCIITRTCAWFNNCGAGGVAWINSFDLAGQAGLSSTIPCWVFVGSVAKSVAEAASHELGHTFGLRHDGRTSPAEEYYEGHGGGDVGWAPIMGTGYDRQLVQWSKGQYANANNQEDDLAIIAGAANGFGYVADEAGNSIGTAAALNAPGGAVNQTGIISGNNDVDFYAVAVGTGVVSMNANPASISPNLDILLELRNGAGAVLASSNPDTLLNAAISQSVAAGTYYIRVQGTGRGDVLGVGYSSYGSIGHYSLSGTVPLVPPGITTQPVSQTVIVGATVTFSVAASGSQPLRYQWRRNGGNISGATNASYMISNVQPTQAGNYTVVVSNARASVTSTTAVLTVNVPPVITAQPQSRTVASGNSVTFSVTASGTAPLRYQWFKNGVALTGSTNATLLLTNVQPYRIGYYSVSVSNVAAIILSTNAALNIPGYDFSQWQGLVAYYPFNGNANDAAGTGNNGTVNGAILTKDRLGASNSAYSFNGSNSVITFSAPPLTQVDNWTMAAWVNPASLSQIGFPVSVGFDNGNIADSDGFGFGFLGNAEWQGLFSGVTYFGSGYSMPATNRWYQVVMLRSAGTTKFFVNGVQTANTYSTTPRTPTSFRIGSMAGIRFFNGQADEVRIYNRALTPDEVKQLYIYEADTMLIPSIYSTGLSDSGTVLADEQLDPHYKLLVNPNNPASSSSVVHDSTVFPIVSGPWIPNSSKSKWIGPARDTTGASAGNYSYQLTLDLTGYDPRTAFLAGSWAADDGGSIFLNGVGTGFRCTNYFVSFSTFTLTSGFVSGTNLIEFRVNNGGSWTGLRVDGLQGTAQYLNNLPLDIVAQPTGATKALSENVVFTVMASGAPPLSYQWRFNGTNINGATSTSLVLTNLQLPQAGNYSVVVANAYGFVISSNAALTVNPLPSCVPAPAGLVSWWSGENNVLDSAGTNHGTLVGNTTYGAARVNEGLVFDGNGAVVQLGNPTGLHLQDLTIETWIRRASTVVTSLDGNGYGGIFCYGNGGYGIFLDPSGTPTLSKVEISEVKPGVTITDTTWHHLVVTKSRSTVVFYVDGVVYPAAPFDPGFTFGNNAFIGGLGGNYTFYGAVDEVSVYNRALAANEIQAIYSAGSAGKCGLPPAILSPPNSQTVLAGANASFGCTVAGTPPLSYQWRFNGMNINGATADSLVLTNLRLSQAGNYDVMVSNNSGSVTSAVATLLVGISIDVYYDFETAATTPIWLGTTQMVQNTSASYRGTNAIALAGYPDGSVLTELPQGTRKIEFYFYDDYGPNPPLYAYMFFRLLEATNSPAFAGFTMNDGGWGTTPPRTMDHYYAYGDEEYSTRTMGPLRTIGWHKFAFALGGSSVVMSVDDTVVFQTNTTRVARYLQFQCSLAGGWGRVDDLVLSVVRVVQPLLTISRTSSNAVVISWPYPSAGFQLQKSAVLNTTTNWETVTNPLVQVGEDWHVTLPLSLDNRYYRLWKP